MAGAFMAASAVGKPWYRTVAAKINRRLVSGPAYQSVAVGSPISSWATADGGYTLTGVNSPMLRQNAKGTPYTELVSGSSQRFSGAVPVTSVEMIALVRAHSGIEFVSDGFKRLGPIWFPNQSTLYADSNSLLDAATNYANGMPTNTWVGAGVWGVISQRRNSGIAIATSGTLNISGTFGAGHSTFDLAEIAWLDTLMTAGELANAVQQLLAKV